MGFFSDFRLLQRFIISRDVDEKRLKFGYVESFLIEKLTVRFQNRPRESTLLIDPQMFFISISDYNNISRDINDFVEITDFSPIFSSHQLFFFIEAPKYLENRGGYALFFLGALSLLPWSEDH